jgi:ABC-type multidrug transport system ATPase subunit
VVRVDGVPLVGGGPALQFEIGDGRCAGLLGSDERTLAHFAHTMAGMRGPIAGRILIDDVDVWRESAQRSQTSVFLPCAAHRLLTLGEHLDTVARIRGSLRFTVAAAIERVGLSSNTRLDTPTARSAAALAAALIPDSRLVVLHQPFAGLDGSMRQRAVDWIRAMSNTRASIIVTGTAEGDVRAISHHVIEAGAAR